MAKPKGMYLRDSTWWACKDIPKELTAILGKTSLKKTLDTSDQAIARVRFHATRPCPRTSGAANAFPAQVGLLRISSGRLAVRRADCPASRHFLTSGRRRLDDGTEKTHEHR
jgi:hypothetical protein